jgi:hypothetical protein
MGNLDEHSSSQVTTSSEADTSECSEMTEEMVKLLPLALTEDESSDEIQRIKVKVRLLLEEKLKRDSQL